MNLYSLGFKFRNPYQVIVDDEFVKVSFKSGSDLLNRLKKTLHGDVKIMITQCSMQELYKTNIQDLINYAKSFERRRCNHKEAIDQKNCIQSIVNVNGENKFRYIVATQNDLLRKELQKIPGVPLIFIHRSIMLMDPISETTIKFLKNIEHIKLITGLNNIKSDQAIDVTKVKKRKISEPNSLSVKKSKKPKVTTVTNTKKTRSKRNFKKKNDTDILNNLVK